MAQRGEHIGIVGKTKSDKMEAALEASRVERKKFILTLARQRVLAEQAGKNKVISMTGEPVQQEEEKTYLDMDETRKRIIGDTSVYRRIYKKLPPVDISDEEWETFYNHVYSLFCKHGFQGAFYETMAYLNRFVLADTLIRHRSRINIRNYVDSLKLLVSDTLEAGMSKKEIATLMKELDKNLPKADIVALSNAGKSRRR